MKELSIEEKAKAYDKAIEKAKELLYVTEKGTLQEETIKSLFPELGESEDERIRQEMIDFLQETIDNVGESPNIWTMANAKKWLAWLEKQGEQKTFIRFGDIPSNEKSKIYNGEDEVGIEDGVSVYPAFVDNKGNITIGLALPITKTTLYTQQHLLEYDNRPCYLVTGDYVGNDSDGQPLIRNVSIVKEIKNYRIKEEKQGEQKPAWSEEDETVLNNLIYALANDRIGNSRDEYVNWLKSLKDRCLPQPKQEWSEEDEAMFSSILTDVKIAWKNTLNAFEDDIEQYQEQERCMNKVLSFLKSLRPQKQWKPSEEQILAINTAINVVGKGTLSGKHLIEILEQLKAL